MSRPTRNKSDAPKKSGSSLLTGILLGMVFGVALAAGLAWYLLKSPSPFVNKEQAVRPAADVAKPEEVVKPAAGVAPVKAETAVAPAVPAEEAKPRFEFYKVLTDKPDAKSAPQPAEAPKPVENKPATAFPPTSLQVGSFATADAAENLKARLAMKGVESRVQTVNSQDGTAWHRVLVGPFQSEKEMNAARASLKQIGIDAALTR
ncbi:MAG: SPOR domain-containing protein [Gallionella sp.]|nr:SPOR domain-containing protein [Gallionella sp.]MDD4947304.1 SPOR domain-containing protein [Gallionella sp.]